MKQSSALRESDEALCRLAHEEALVTTPFSVVFALYPEITQLDFTGPFEVLSRLPGARTIVASVKGGEIRAGGLSFSNVESLAAVEACDLICVPGGYGTIEAMEDSDYLDALRRLSKNARYVTSVCTGSLLLGAAGLIKGRRAACHWAWRDLLPDFGAIPDPARVVRDGHIITGGGVTAGIDMALAVMAEIAGRDYAEAQQLAIEYAPDPPFDGGRPERVRPEILNAVRARNDTVRGRVEEVARRAAQRLGG